jgi:hypothetical protein
VNYSSASAFCQQFDAACGFEETNRPPGRPTVHRESTGGAVNHAPRVALDVIDVREPCPRNWNEMTGDDRTRFCAGCGMHVHNLSAMPRDDAERLVCESAGRLCVRFERTQAGAVRTLDYAKPPAGRGWRFWTMFGVLGALAATAAGTLWDRPKPQRPNVVMGRQMPVISSPQQCSTTPASDARSHETPGEPETP